MPEQTDSSVDFSQENVFVHLSAAGEAILAGYAKRHEADPAVAHLMKSTNLTSLADQYRVPGHEHWIALTLLQFMRIFKEYDGGGQSPFADNRVHFKNPFE